MRATHAGVQETSYYPALSNLLNEIGKTLKSKVHCIINLQDTGAKLPDGGLFTEEQIKNDQNDVLMVLRDRRLSGGGALARSRRRWPRIPLPATRGALMASAALGREIVVLLDPEGRLPTAAKILKSVGPITTDEGTPDPDSGDLPTYAYRLGATPRKGKV